MPSAKEAVSSLLSHFFLSLSLSRNKWDARALPYLVVDAAHLDIAARRHAVRRRFRSANLNSRALSSLFFSFFLSLSLSLS